MPAAHVVQLVKLHIAIDAYSPVELQGRSLSTRTTRTSRATGGTVSHYRQLEVEWNYEKGPKSTRTTRTSHATGEIASHH